MTKTTYFTGQKRQHTFADDNWYLVRIAMIILELVGNTLLVCVITSLVDPYIANGYKHMTEGLRKKLYIHPNNRLQTCLQGSTTGNYKSGLC